MLSRVEVRTRQGVLLKLPLEDAENGLAVLDIQGLNPVQATLVSSGFAGMDGQQYHSARREARNIKLAIGLEADYVDTSVQDLRRRLYGFFMPKSEVNLRFVMDTGLYVDISGRVETFETPLFSKEPAVDISLMCFSPDFVDPNPVTISGVSTALEDETLVTYPDDGVDTGIMFTLRPNRSLTEFTIYHRPPDEIIRTMDFSIPLLDQDVLKISTVTGDKWATLTRANVVSSALYGVSPRANWIELQPGDNYIRVYAEGAPVPFEIEYTARYGGL